MVFAAEGNNAPDARRLADAVNQYLNLTNPCRQEPDMNDSLPEHVHWLAPTSWKYVYGSAARGVY